MQFAVTCVKVGTLIKISFCVVVDVVTQLVLGWRGWELEFLRAVCLKEAGPLEAYSWVAQSAPSKGGNPRILRKCAFLRGKDDDDDFLVCFPKTIIQGNSQVERGKQGEKTEL